MTAQDRESGYRWACMVDSFAPNVPLTWQPDGAKIDDKGLKRQAFLLLFYEKQNYLFKGKTFCFAVFLLENSLIWNHPTYYNVPFWMADKDLVRQKSLHFCCSLSPPIHQSIVFMWKLLSNNEIITMRLWCNLYHITTQCVLYCDANNW